MKTELTESEWKIALRLWTDAPMTIMQLTHALETETGWKKNTVITFLNRMEAKGAVYHEDGDKARLYYPAVSRDEATLSETQGFLRRVFHGNTALMLNTMIEQGTLTDDDIRALYERISGAEHDA